MIADRFEEFEAPKPLPDFPFPLTIPVNSSVSGTFDLSKDYPMKEPGEYIIGTIWAIHVELADRPLPPPEERNTIANMICTPARVVVKARN